MNEVRIYALGGLDEDGKNLTVVEINQDIFIIDAGLKYPDGQRLGVEFIIPDFKSLVEKKDRIKGIFITHGHDDAMSALPYFIKQANLPIYTTALTAALLEDVFKENAVKDYTIKVIKRNETFTIDGTHIKTFGLTHSIADAFGLAIDTPMGYVVYAGEYIIDFNTRLDAFSCDITNFAEIGKKGVFALLTESVAADRPGFTAPAHRVSDFIESALEERSTRLIITMYEQNLFRLIEILEMAKKYKRKVYFANPNQRKLLGLAEKLGYYKMPMELEVTEARFKNEMEDIIVIISGSGLQTFKIMHKIAISEDSTIELRPSDTVLIASPVVPGTEIEAGRMENELYKEDVRVVTLDKRKVFSMHASIEDIKMLTYLMKPKYFIPIHGEYRHLIANANVALDIGYYADKIVVLDNGQIATFTDGRLANTANHIPLEEILIDGNEHLDFSGLILKDRELLSTDGVMVVGIVINFNTKEVIGGPDVQSRGVIYLKDADHIVKDVGNIMEKVISDLVTNRKYDNMAARNEAKDKMSKYIFKETGKRPMILPVIIELNVSE